tara:strand:- start:566 stop:1084 length:519 start_codon:yes stop_codon:yes gene_type:complete
MGLKQDLKEAFQKADDAVSAKPSLDYAEEYANFQTEAILKFLENAKFRITKLNAPVVVESLKTRDLAINLALQTLLGDKAPILDTIKKIPGGSEVVSGLESELKKAVQPLLEGAGIVPGIDIDKSDGGLECTGYVHIGGDPDSQDAFNVDDKSGQQDFTEVQFFREDNESEV